MFKQTILVAAVAGMVLALAAASASADIILFADTFDRPDNTDLNASTAGKSGTLGALNYATTTSGGGMEITSNMLKGGDNGAAAGWAIAYINDHNFTDAYIASGGGFSISIDLVQYATNGSGRWMSIGVGQSLAELTAGTSGQSGGNGDLVVGYRWTTKSLEIRKNGTLDSTTAISAFPVPQTMSIDYAFSDFNAGSTVNYEVSLGSSSIKTGSFTWSGTNENYIDIHSNLSTRQARVDNFAISYVPEPATLALLSLGGLGLILGRKRR